ncbi:MAG: ABC transporter permease [Candidatus Bathyarchaeia archaeon]
MDMESKLYGYKIKMQPFIRELKFTAKRIRSSPLSIVGALIVVFFVILALVAPLLASPGHPSQGGNPYMMPKYGIAVTPKPPGSTIKDGYVIFGTTAWQYDIYYGCIWGSRSAFRIGLLVIIPSLLILGSLSGYYGGYMDEALMRLTDIILAFPSLILCMAFIVVLVPLGIERLDAVMLAFVLVSWPGYARTIRGEVLRVKNEDYIEAARAIGCSDLRVIFRHILPNAIYPVVIMASLDIGTIVLSVAALTFLGLGAPEGWADWGQLIAYSRNFIYGKPNDPFCYWYTFVIPGLFISLFTLGWNLLGDAFRDILDPTIRRK